MQDAAQDEMERETERPAETEYDAAEPGGYGDESESESEFEGESGAEAGSASTDAKLRLLFDGKIVRKDLTKNISQGANVPVYVLEYLLGQYCGSDDDEIIRQGMDNVRRILADNFVRPDEAQKIMSALRERGSYTVID